MPIHLGNPVAQSESLAQAWQEAMEPTSSNLAFPLNSSSRSFKRNCNCVRSPSKAFVRLLSCALRFRYFSSSEFTRANLSCNSARERCASVRSARVAIRASWSEGSGDPGPDGCPFEVAVGGMCCLLSAGVGATFAVRSASWVSDNVG